MSDLIDRQTAIKAIEDLPNCYNGFSDTYDKSCIIGVLEEVPSAQPNLQQTCNKLATDCISRQAALEVVGINTWAGQRLLKLPSAPPERKEGRWIYYPKASGSISSTAVYLYPVCSECGREHPIANYCPNCGSYNGGEDE